MTIYIIYRTIALLLSLLHTRVGLTLLRTRIGQPLTLQFGGSERTLGALADRIVLSRYRYPYYGFMMEGESEDREVFFRDMQRIESDIRASPRI